MLHVVNGCLEESCQGCRLPPLPRRVHKARRLGRQNVAIPTLIDHDHFVQSVYAWPRHHIPPSKHKAQNALIRKRSVCHPLSGRLRTNVCRPLPCSVMLTHTRVATQWLRKLKSAGPVKLSLDTTDRNDLIVRDRTYMHRRQVLVILGDMCRTGASTEAQLWTHTRHGYSNLMQVVV